MHFRGVGIDRSAKTTKQDERKTMTDANKPLVAIVMGSKSDWETMRHAKENLDNFGVANECRVISAHRMPGALSQYVAQLESRGVEVVIAGAGGAAHLPGVIAGQTLVPVLGVPIQTAALGGMDSLLSIVQMPGGIPVGTMAIGKAGAINAALLAVAFLGNKYPELRKGLGKYRAKMVEKLQAEMEI